MFKKQINDKVSISVIFNQAYRNLPLLNLVNVQDIEQDRFPHLIHDPFKTQGLKLYQSFKTIDKFERRLILKKTRDGNIILYEPVVDRQDCVAVIMPNQNKYKKHFIYLDRLTSVELQVLLNIDRTVCISDRYFEHYLTKRKLNHECIAR